MDDTENDPDENIIPDQGSESGQGLFALPPSDWQAIRCTLSKELKDPASEEARLAWDNDQLPEKNRYDDFENPKGFYKLLGCSKVSSDDDIARAVKREKKRNKSKIVKYHHDKNMDKPEEERQPTTAKYRHYKNKMELIVCVEEGFGSPDANGHYQKRVQYDQIGKTLLQDMMNVSVSCLH